MGNNNAKGLGGSDKKVAAGGTLTEAEALTKVTVIEQCFNPREREQLLKLLSIKHYKDGELVIKQGDDGNEFFMIRTGSVDVYIESGEGKDKAKKVINHLEVGDYFGENALLSNVKRLASVEAKGATSCWVLGQQAFLQHFGNKRIFGARTAVSAEASGNVKQKGPMIVRDSNKDAKTTEFLLKAVADNLLFVSLMREQKKAVVAEMWRVACPSGKAIIQQGAVNDDIFYVVESGAFDIFVNKVKVATRAHGECFGELALMYGEPRKATVVATSDAKLWAVDRFVFRERVAAIHKQSVDAYERALSQIERVPILRELSVEDRRKVIDAIEEVHVPAGHALMKQGESKPKDGTLYMYFLVEGECVCTKDGKVETIYKPGGYFGELALITDEPRKATITTTKECMLFALSAEDFRSLSIESFTQDIKQHMSKYKLTVPAAAAAPQDSKSGPAAPAPAVAAPAVAAVAVAKPHGGDEHIDFKDLFTVRALGKGAFGTVKLVKHKKTGKLYALKSVWKKQVVETGQQGHIMSEKWVMANLNFPFLCRLHATHKDTNRLFFLMEVCMAGDLFTVLRARTLFPEDTARFYAASVVLAFEFMHEKNIIYRDLKPENLLLDHLGFLKVTDFGFAKEIGKDGRTWTLCGTPDYLSPEIVSGKGHGKAVDWWTLGVLIYEMLASYPPFYDEEPMKTYQKIVSGKVTYPPHFSPEATNLISKLLQLKPANRLGVIKGGAALIKAHPWFKGFDWNAHVAQKIAPPILLPVTAVTEQSGLPAIDPESEMPPEMRYTDDGTNWDKDF